MSGLHATIQSLFGSDPLAAEQAVATLAREDAASIAEVVPLSGGMQARNLAAEIRLANLARLWGDSIVPHLEHCIREGSWPARLTCTPFFGGLTGSEKAQSALVGILRYADDFDAQRMAIEALGWLGADDHAWDLDHHVRKGRWDRNEFESDDRISSDPYDKLWPYGIAALARMAAQASDRSKVRHLMIALDEALLLQLREKPNIVPNGIHIVFGLAHVFEGRHIDPLIAQWGKSKVDGISTSGVDARLPLPKRICLHRRQRLRGRQQFLRRHPPPRSPRHKARRESS